MLREHGPRLLRMMPFRGLPAVEPLLDLLLLPLGFHALLLAGSLLGASPFLRVAGCTGFGVLLLHIATAIARGTSVKQDLRALIQAPGYVLWKLVKLPAILAARGPAVN